MLVIDEDPTRIESVALAVHATAPDAKILVFDATANDTVTAAIAAVTDATRDPGATVVIIRADPASWTTVTVLAALRPPHHTGPVDALVVTEGPLERLPVLVTDFPGLRLLPPDSQVASTVAALVTAGDAGGQLPA
jgi:hypothetical protein